MFTIPKWITLWLVVSSIIVLFDASYVLLRPATMRGGPLFSFYSPYDLYIKFDTLYGNLSDSFVVIQSWLNLIEISMILFGVYLSRSSDKRIKAAIVMIVASAFVFWKTVIYVLYSHDHTTADVKQLTTQAILVFVIPTLFWLICPILTIIALSKKLVRLAEKQV